MEEPRGSTRFTGAGMGWVGALRLCAHSLGHCPRRPGPSTHCIPFAKQGQPGDLPGREKRPPEGPSRGSGGAGKGGGAPAPVLLKRSPPSW